VFASRFFGAFTGIFDRRHAGIVAPGPNITNPHAPPSLLERFGAGRLRPDAK
jgi:hypothetical protein